VVRSHGDLPCPSCGYLRRGIEWPTRCPECGAPGFEGEFVVSGLPALDAERAGPSALLNFGNYLLIFSTLFIPGIIGRFAGSWAQRAIAVAGIMLMAGAAGYFLYRRHRRRKEVASGLSLERVVWEFGPEGVLVRHHDDSTRVPYAEIRECWSSIHFVTRRTTVVLHLRGKSLADASRFPQLRLQGPLPEQRAAVAEMKRRIAASSGAG
jgi:hypothetical protein